MPSRKNVHRSGKDAERLQRRRFRDPAVHSSEADGWATTWSRVRTHAAWGTWVSPPGLLPARRRSMTSPRGIPHSE